MPPRDTHLPSPERHKALCSAAFPPISSLPLATLVARSLAMLRSGGWDGNFHDLVYPPFTLRERLASWYKRKPRWWMRPLGRKLCRLRKSLLPSWLRCRGMNA
jgi:hypothetical protein